MGTTLTADIIYEDVVVIGHVGDSRAYLIRNGSIYQITEDHSLVADQIKDGKITHEEALISPQRSVITRSIGTDPKVIPEIYQRELEEGDGILLCTDGLNDLVEDEEMLTIMMNTKSIEQTCDNLIELANQRGGYDNVTVIALEFGRFPRRGKDSKHAPTTPIGSRRRGHKLIAIFLAIVLLALLAVGSYFVYERLSGRGRETLQEATLPIDPAEYNSENRGEAEQN